MPIDVFDARLHYQRSRRLPVLLLVFQSRAGAALASIRRQGKDDAIDVAALPSSA